MTYQEIKDRLTKCELTLEKLKNGSSNTPESKSQIEKLTILKESYLKLLNEADKGMVYTDDERKAKELADDGVNVKLTVKERLKEQEGVKFSIDETKSIAKSVGKAVATALKSLGDEVGHMKAKNIEENSFEIYVQYKKDTAEDTFSFYIVDDTLHLVDFSFDKELTDVGVKPSGEAIVNVDVLSNELVKHFRAANEGKYKSDAQRKAIYATKAEKGELDEAPEGMYYIKIPKDAASQNKAQVIFNDLYGIKYEINDDPDGIIMYFKKEDFDPGLEDDLMGDGVEILDTNMPLSEGEEGLDKLAQDQKDHDEETYDREIGENEAEDTEGGDLDIGHQDDEPDMLKQYAYDIATYASKLYKALDKYDKYDGEVDFPNWWQSKVILARDYISKAQHYLEFEEKQPAIDQLALEGKVNERFRFLSPEKQKANDAKFEKRMALLKALEKGIELHKAGKISDEELHNLKLKAGTISAEGKDMGISKKKETKFHKDLDTLVHDTFGKREEEMDENRFLAASMEDLEQVIRNLAHTGEMSEDEAIELAIRKLEAMLDGRDDLDEGIGKTKKALDLVITKMKELAKQYKAGDKSVIDDLKYYTAKKKSLEAMLDRDVSGKNRGQELAEGRGDMDTIVSVIEDRASESGFDVQDEAIEVIEGIADHYELGEVQFEYQNEAQLNEQATCCGRCGRVHVKGTKCKTPYLKGKDHCRNN